MFPRTSSKLLDTGILLPIITVPSFNILNTSFILFEMFNILYSALVCLIVRALPIPLFSISNCSVVYISVYNNVFSP